MNYLLTTEADATRLDLTARWDGAAMAGEPQLARRNKAELDFTHRAAENLSSQRCQRQHAAGGRVVALQKTSAAITPSRARGTARNQHPIGLGLYPRT